MSDYHTRKTAGSPGGLLVVTFHGTGGNENQFHGFAEGLFPSASILSPRGDVSEGGALRFFRRRGMGVYDMDDLAQRVGAMAGFIRREAGQAQATRVLGLGYSNGANILAAVSFDHSALFDGLILMHPLIPWTPGPQPGLSGRQLLITAGRQDPICPPDQTHALSDYYKVQGAQVTEHWHPGGHEITEDEIGAVAQFARHFSRD